MSFSFPKHQQRQMVVGARAVEKKVKVGRWSSSSPNVVLDGFTPIFHRFDPCGPRLAFFLNWFLFSRFSTFL